MYTFYTAALLFLSLKKKQLPNKYHVLLGDITHKKKTPHEPVGGASAVPDSKHNIAQPECRISLA